jgi:hypothetical protein
MDSAGSAPTRALPETAGEVALPGTQRPVSWLHFAARFKKAQSPTAPGFRLHRIAT